MASIYDPLRMREIVVVGAGGIGAPAALALCEAGVEAILVVDDDRVELSNLHRQFLFEEAHLGRPKAEVMAETLSARYPGTRVLPLRSRVLPETVEGLVARAAVVVDGTDNFASRFLLADAAHLGGRPIVHAAALRWQATVMAVPVGGAPCYRCLFEDLPRGEALSCATGGVAGPVCGVSGALAADRALALLAGDPRARGQILTYDGTRDRLRAVGVRAREACPLCGPRALIGAVESSRYMGALDCDPA
ncbi:MAG: HesA/MoeB/ThiF family protein [Polyangiaceae bacterium]